MSASISVNATAAKRGALSASPAPGRMTVAASGRSSMAELKLFPDGECDGCPIPILYCAVCKNREAKKIHPIANRPFGGECVLFKNKELCNDKAKL